MAEITYKQCWDELKDQHENNLEKVVNSMLDIVTAGMWVMWDEEKIDQKKTELLNIFNKEGKCNCKDLIAPDKYHYCYDKEMKEDK